MKAFLISAQQEPAPDGLRYTRGCIVRNTSPELRTTTIKTWLDWFPEKQFGKMRWSAPFTHNIAIDDIRAEIIFLALDREEDISKLLSLELTWIWFNEAREIRKTMIEGGLGRTGRYPAIRVGGPTWYGGFADTNAPANTHWWPIMSGEAPIPDEMTREDRITLVKPESWSFYTQPPAMFDVVDEAGDVTGYELNPNAENLQNLVPGYYENQIQGRRRSYIEVYIQNKLGQIVHGDPVYGASFRTAMHVAKGLIAVDDSVPLRVGLDFGLTPAAIICQRFPNGTWHIIKEVVRTNMAANRFAPQLKAIINEMLPDPRHPVMFTGDPKGEDRASTDKNTVYNIFAAQGMKIIPAATNDISQRIETVEVLLSTLIEGMPAVQISRVGCPTLVEGFQHGYVYRRGEPDKNIFSHVHDALQYVFMGAGEQQTLMVARDQFVQPVQARRRHMNLYSRLRSHSRTARAGPFARR